jgi:hypothetical protein
MGGNSRLIAELANTSRGNSELTLTAVTAATDFPTARSLSAFNGK